MKPPGQELLAGLQWDTGSKIVTVHFLAYRPVGRIRCSSNSGWKGISNRTRWWAKFWNSVLHSYFWASSIESTFFLSKPMACIRSAVQAWGLREKTLAVTRGNCIKAISKASNLFLRGADQQDFFAGSNSLFPFSLPNHSPSGFINQNFLLTSWSNLSHIRKNFIAQADQHHSCWFLWVRKGGISWGQSAWGTTHSQSGISERGTLPGRVDRATACDKFGWVCPPKSSGQCKSRFFPFGE